MYLFYKFRSFEVWRLYFGLFHETNYIVFGLFRCFEPVSTVSRQTETNRKNSSETVRTSIPPGAAQALAERQNKYSTGSYLLYPGSSATQTRQTRPD